MEASGAPERALAHGITRAYRTRGLPAPETLLDATRSVHSRRHRPLARKLSREVAAALGAGVPAATLRALLEQYVHDLVLVPLPVDPAPALRRAA